MELLFENRSDIEPDEKCMDMLRELICASLRHEGLPTDIQVGLSFVGGDEIRRLNNKFRKIDRETDVLSFPMYDLRTEKPEFGAGDVCLGDIVICMPQAVRQSAEYGHSIERELGFLTVHSMLHLMGYDHMTEEDEREMFSLQKQILDEAGLKR